MSPQEELRMAWALWHMLSQLTDQLWERYEEDFMRLSLELDRHDIWEFGREHGDGPR